MNSPYRRRTFSSQELAALTSAAPSRWWRGFIALQSTTGMRTQEILRLPKSVFCARSCTIQVTANPPLVPADYDLVDLRTPLTAAQERTVNIAKWVARALADLADERWEDRYLFVPDWKLDQLWLRASAGSQLQTDDICPKLNEGFQVVQQLAQVRLAKGAGGARCGRLRWPLRPIAALRETAITTLALRMTPEQLAVQLGYLSTGPLLRYYRGKARMGGAA